MFKIFSIKNNYLFHINHHNITTMLHEAIWIDIITSTENTHDLLNNKNYQHIVNFFELKRILKKTNRFFKDQNKIHIESYFFEKNKHNQIKNFIVSFTIYNNRLYTLRNKKSLIFDMYQKSSHTHLLSHNNAHELLLNLFETKLDDIADKIEYVYHTLKKINFKITNKQKIKEYNKKISDLTTLENIGWNIHLNLLDTKRSIIFLMYKSTLPTEQKKYAQEILNYIKLLFPHNEGILQKINYLIQTTMGLINLEQNRIIKIFSVIFLPPTLIASSYGMNFEFMPELQWSFGYPSAIILMILSGLVPYLYCKYKHWL